MTLHDWLQAVPGAVLAILAGLLLRALRRIYWAQVDTNSHVKTQAAATQTTALDVHSLQGWARGVDLQLAGVKDDHDSVTALKGDVERIKAFMAELEGMLRAEG